MLARKVDVGCCPWSCCAKPRWVVDGEGFWRFRRWQDFVECTRFEKMGSFTCILYIIIFVIYIYHICIMVNQFVFFLMSFSFKCDFGCLSSTPFFEF